MNMSRIHQKYALNKLHDIKWSLAVEPLWNQLVCPINPTGIRICFACIIIICEMLMLYSTLPKRSHACGGGSGFVVWLMLILLPHEPLLLWAFNMASIWTWNVTVKENCSKVPINDSYIGVYIYMHRTPAVQNMQAYPFYWRIESLLQFRSGCWEV